MKKIIIASLLAALAGPAAAAAITSGAAITPTDCTLLETGASVKINLSTGNVGAYDCDATTASIGVAVASTSGKNKVYSASSAGGGIVETSTSAAPTASDVSTAAETASASS